MGRSVAVGAASCVGDGNGCAQDCEAPESQEGEDWKQHVLWYRRVCLDVIVSVKLGLNGYMYEML